MKSHQPRRAPRASANDRSHHARSRRCIAYATIAGLAPLLASCALTPTTPSTEAWNFEAADIQALIPDLRDKGFNEQADSFEDGQVTAEEYQESIHGLRDCVESKGYGFSAPQLSPVTGLTYEFVYHLNGRDSTQAQEHINACEDRHTTPLTTIYLSTHTQKMDPTLKSALIHCLEAEGKQGNAEGNNLAEIAPVNQEDESLRKAARKCVLDIATELFPELPSVSIYD